MPENAGKTRAFRLRKECRPSKTTHEIGKNSRPATAVRLRRDEAPRTPIPRMPRGFSPMWSLAFPTGKNPAQKTADSPGKRHGDFPPIRQDPKILEKSTIGVLEKFKIPDKSQYLRGRAEAA